LLINPLTSSEEQSKVIDFQLTLIENISSVGKKLVVEWTKPSEEEYKTGIRIVIPQTKPVTQIAWHAKGNYFASVSPNAGSKSVLIHRLAQKQSQMPFKKNKGVVQCVQFHPTQPLFFVATQKYIRIYNLVKQSLMKKLLAGVNGISSIDVHSGGDNIIMGSLDTRVCWFDLDLSVKPYKILRYHKEPVRRVVFHPRYNLFASCSDEGAIHIFHCTVFSDLLSNAAIVPVNVLSTNQRDTESGMGTLDCIFHPSQPWIFAAGANNTIHLYTQ